MAEGNIVYGGENRAMLDGRWTNHDWQLGRNVYWSTGEPANDQMLVGHWNFEGSDGYTVDDRSGHGNHGEIRSRLATGKFGTAMLCSAKCPYVTIEDHGSLDFGTGDFSVDLWICPTDLAIRGSDPRRRFLSKSDHPDTWWVMDITSEGRIILGMGDPNQVSRTSQTGIPENAWSHVAVVADRSNCQVRFYLNGQRDSRIY